MFVGRCLVGHGLSLGLVLIWGNVWVGYGVVFVVYRGWYCGSYYDTQLRRKDEGKKIPLFTFFSFQGMLVGENLISCNYI